MQNQNYNQNQVNMNQNISSMTTGNQKVVITQTPNKILTEQKSSFYNPISGVSQKKKKKTVNKKYRTSQVTQNQGIFKSSSSSSSSSNSSSSSIDEKEKLRNLAYQDQLPRQHATKIKNPAPQVSQYPVYANQVQVNTNLTQNPQPIINQSNYLNKIQNSSLLTESKGYVKSSGDVTKTKQKLVYKDPVTGIQQQAIIKTKTTEKNKNVHSTKDSYDYKVENTSEGPKTIIKQKHRQGGVFENIKNKLTNLMNNA